MGASLTQALQTCIKRAVRAPLGPNALVRFHPFIERLIGTIRREYLDRLFFWTALGLERKLELFKNYYNAARVHQGLSGDTPNGK